MRKGYWLTDRSAGEPIRCHFGLSDYRFFSHSNKTSLRRFGNRCAEKGSSLRGESFKQRKRRAAAISALILTNGGGGDSCVVNLKTIFYHRTFFFVEDSYYEALIWINVVYVVDSNQNSPARGFGILLSQIDIRALFTSSFVFCFC